MDKLMKFFKDEEGLELVEYAVMLALIVVAIIVTISVVGTEIESSFNTVYQKLSSSNAASAS
jgi:Flp pilus assembly pilin Flp